MKIILKKCICINLEDRIDRLKKTQIEFHKINNYCHSKNIPNVDLEFFSAVKMKDGRLGLIKSINEIIKKNYKEEYICIIEDDIFILDSEKIFNSLNNVPDDWDMLSGGGYFIQQPKVINDNWISVNYFSSTHFIIIRNSLYDTILKSENQEHPIDAYISKLLLKEKLKVYVIHPMPCKQFGGYSDIRKMNVDYNSRTLPWCKNIYF